MLPYILWFVGACAGNCCMLCKAIVASCQGLRCNLSRAMLQLVELFEFNKVFIGPTVYNSLRAIMYLCYCCCCSSCCCCCRRHCRRFLSSPYYGLLSLSSFHQSIRLRFGRCRQCVWPSSSPLVHGASRGSSLQHCCGWWWCRRILGWNLFSLRQSAGCGVWGIRRCGRSFMAESVRSAAASDEEEELDRDLSINF